MTDRINTESHPLSPFLPEGAKMLLLGAFPPKREKWSIDFYYPNFINDMWRIFGLILHDNKNFYVDVKSRCFKQNEIKTMLSVLKIAVGDTALEVERLRDNASDKYLKINRTLDLERIIAKVPSCHVIATTGEKASGVIAMLTNTNIPTIGNYEMIEISGRFLRHYRMPSSSRAYPMKLEKKAEYYKTMLKEIEIV